MNILFFVIGMFIGACLFMLPFLWCLCRASSIDSRDREMRELIREMTSIKHEETI